MGTTIEINQLEQQRRYVEELKAQDIDFGLTVGAAFIRGITHPRLETPFRLEAVESRVQRSARHRAAGALFDQFANGGGTGGMGHLRATQPQDFRSIPFVAVGRSGFLDVRTKVRTRSDLRPGA